MVSESIPQDPSELDHYDQIAGRRLGRSDFLKLSGAVAAGLLLPKSALAAIESASKMESPRHLYGPPGVKEIPGVYAKAPEVLAEEQAALKAVDGRWMGILYLHKGKTPNLVNFTSSPTAYHTRPLGGVPDFSNRRDGDYLYIFKPYIINNFKGRTYAAIYDNDYHFSFLDLAWAKSNGNLSALAIKGMKPREVAFKFGQDAGDLPGYAYTGLDPSFGWIANSDQTHPNRIVHYRPTKAMPKIRTKK
jgi:hypothetical protein